MDKNVMIIVGVVIVAGLVIGGVLLASKKTNPKETVVPVVTATPAPASEAVAEPEAPISGNVVEVTVTGSNFKFAPNTIKAKKGDTVRITFVSNQGSHDLTIDEFDVATSQLADGEEEEVEFVADKVGTFEYYCSVGNHRKMGMVGKLIVE